jgi:hypothetical protein
MMDRVEIKSYSELKYSSTRGRLVISSLNLFGRFVVFFFVDFADSPIEMITPFFGL